MNDTSIQQRKAKFQTGNVVAISIAHLVHDIYSAFIAPILPLLIAKFGFSLSSAGFLMVISRLPALLTPFVGILADRLSVRFFIVIAPSVTAVSMSLLGAANGYAMLAILCFIMGVSATCFHVPAPVMIRHAAGDRVGKGMSFYMLGGELARTLGPLVILTAVSLWGLDGSYRLIPFGLMASLALYSRIKNIEVAGEAGAARRRTSLKKTVKTHLGFLVILGGITLANSFMVGALTTFLPTYLNLVKGETLWLSGISLAVTQFAGAAGTFFCGTISDKIGRKQTLLIIAAGAPVFMILFMLLEGVIMIPLLILIGFSLLGSPPVLLAMVQELDSDWPAFMNSILGGMYFFLGAVGVMTVGFLGSRIGLEKTFWICAFTGFASIPFILKIKRPG